MLKQRVITGVLLALGALSAITLLPPHVLGLVLGLVTVLACWEWSDLAGVQRTFGRVAYCVLSVGAMLVLAQGTSVFSAAPKLDLLRSVLGVAALWWCIALVWVRAYPASAAVWGSVAVRLLMGWLTLLPAWLALVYLGEQADGGWKIVFLLSLVAAADSGAYFTGKAFGRRKLSPAVSPGKSWEGFWGGLASSLLLAALVWWRYWSPVALPAWLLVIALTTLASVLGDLLESMIKRQRGVKDSGRLLPGHGGVMDRLDSISAAVPIFALGLLLVR